MNNYTVETSKGTLRFQAVDSDFAVWEANRINLLPKGQSERVSLLLADNGYNCGQFDLEGAAVNVKAEQETSLDYAHSIAWEYFNDSEVLVLSKNHYARNDSVTLCGVNIEEKKGSVAFCDEVNSSRCKRCASIAERLNIEIE